MRKLIFVLLLTGCSATGKIDVDKAVVAHTNAITAIAQYVGALQELGVLPTAEEAQKRLAEKEAKDKAEKEKSAAKK